MVKNYVKFRNHIKVAYNQKDGLDLKNINIDYGNPRIIDETEELPPLEVHDGEIAKQYLKHFENEIIEAQKNHAELLKEMELLVKYIGKTLETAHNRIYAAENDYTCLSEYHQEMLRLGFKVKEEEYLGLMNNKLEQIRKLLTDNTDELEE